MQARLVLFALFIVFTELPHHYPHLPIFFLSREKRKLLLLMITRFDLSG